MTVRPERLWDQYFGKAESESDRGMGIWPRQPHPCELEPPWDPFDRRSLTLWDCMLHGWEAPWEGSWFRKLFFPSPPVYQQGRPIVLPEVGYSVYGELVPIVVEQFPEDESTIPKSEELLRSLVPLSRPVSFEIIGIGPQPEIDNETFAEILRDQGKNGRKRTYDEAISGWTEPYTKVQFVAHPDDARRLERHLVAHYPNSAVVVGDRASLGSESMIPRDVRWADGYGVTLALDNPFCFPLRRFTRIDPDPLGVAIAAMEDLGREEWAMVQVLLQRAQAPWADTLTEAVTDPYQGELMVPGLSEKILREKFGSPLYTVSIRILARREDVFRQLRGWAEQFAAPPQAFEFLLDDDETNSLSTSIEYRCTHRPGVLLNTQELASLVHLPSQSIVSERLRQIKSRTRPAVEAAPEPSSVLLGENVHRGKKRLARIPATLRPRHCYVAGASGTGKSTLLLNMILQDIAAGHGVGVLDPHGDLVNAVLKRIPTDRIEDVILFDPSDKGFPFALNILEAKDDSEAERIVAEMLMALSRYFPESWGPRLERILTFTLYTVLEVIPGATLADVERMLIDREFREQVIQKTRTSRYVDFWDKEFGFLPKDAAGPVLNKLSVFLLNRTVRNIICQRHSAIDFDRVLNGRKILLAKLSTGQLTERIAGMFGSFLVTKIVNAAFRRANIPEEHRQPWYLYVDEFQAFMNLSVGFDRILAEARKYKLVLAGLANQYVGQLSPAVRQAIFGNVGTMVVFRLGVDDAHTAAKEMGVFTVDEILNLELGQAIVRAGGSATAFNVSTYSPLELPGCTLFAHASLSKQDVAKDLLHEADLLRRHADCLAKAAKQFLQADRAVSLHSKQPMPARDGSASRQARRPVSEPPRC